MRLSRAAIAIIGIVLIVIIAGAGAASAVPTHVDSVMVTKFNDDGSSTQTVIPDAYTVRTSSDWLYILEHQSDYLSKTLVLTDNIVFTGPCGSFGSSSDFTGTIYGNGYSFKNFTSTVYGLIRYTGDGCMLNGVCLNTSNIDSSGNEVGGLIGRVSSSATVNGVHLTGCRVTLSSISGSDAAYGAVGGLVGSAMGKLWINASSVDRSCLNQIPSSGTSSIVGGLVGWAYGANLTIANSWVKESYVGSQYSDVGGLIGQCFTLSTESVVNLVDSHVVDCRIWSTSGDSIGGLVGSTTRNNVGAVLQTLNMNGCTVENCTIGAYNNIVGGLFGKVENVVIHFGSDACSVSNSWVDGTSETTNAGKRGSIFGSNSTGSTWSAGAWPTHSAVYRLTNGGQSTGTVAGLDNSYTGQGYAQPTLMSPYGSVIDRQGWIEGNQYGYNPTRLVFQVTVSKVGKGTASADRARYTVGETVQLHQTADTGSQFISWSSVPKVAIAESRFIMPESNVQITATFGNASMRGVTFEGVPTTGAWVYADSNLTIPVNVSNYTTGMSAFRLVIEISGVSANDPPTYNTTNGAYIDVYPQHYEEETWAFAYNEVNVTMSEGTTNRTVFTLIHSGISVYGKVFGFDPFTIGYLKIPLENRSDLGHLTLRAWMTEAYDEAGNPIDGDTGVIPLGVRPYPRNITYYNNDTGVALDRITALKEDTVYGKIAAHVYTDTPSKNLFDATLGDTIRWSLDPVGNDTDVASIKPNDTNPTLLSGNRTGTANLSTVIEFTSPTIVYPAVVQYAHDDPKLWRNLTLYNNGTHMVQTGSEIQYAYTLNIPADFSLKQNQVITKYVEVSNFTIPKDEQLNVYISSEQFDGVGNQYRMYYLADTDVRLNYTIETNGTVIRENNQAILVANQTQKDFGVTTLLNFSITEKPPEMGAYRDRLTFMVNFTKVANATAAENT